MIIGKYEAILPREQTDAEKPDCKTGPDRHQKILELQTDQILEREDRQAIEKEFEIGAPDLPERQRRAGIGQIVKEPGRDRRREIDADIEEQKHLDEHDQNDEKLGQEDGCEWLRRGMELFPGIVLIFELG